MKVKFFILMLVCSAAASPMGSSLLPAMQGQAGYPTVPRKAKWMDHATALLKNPSDNQSPADSKSFGDLFRGMSAKEEHLRPKRGENFIKPPFPENFVSLLPDPSPEAFKRQFPKKKIAVFDLDGTLIDTIKVKDGSEAPKGHPVLVDHKGQKKVVILRTDIYPLLDKISEKYELALWTARDELLSREIASLINRIGNKEYFKLDHVFSNRIMSESSPAKDLTKLGFDMRGIVMIDNRAYSFYDNTVRLPGTDWEVPTNGFQVLDFVRNQPKEIYEEENKVMIELLDRISSLVDIRPELAKHFFDTEDLMPTSHIGNS